jgi:uncharacterized protein
MKKRYQPITLKQWLSSPLTSALRALVHLYGYTLSSLVGGHCRHLPTCSEYADEALLRHGALRGLILTTRRVATCNPWGKAGLDPVPPADKP